MIVRVGYYQYDPRFGRVRENLDRVIKKLDGVQADLVVLPELAFTGYHFQGRAEVMKLAESAHDSSTVSSLIALCHRNHFHLATGFAERSADKCFNSALLLGPGGIEHVYRKLHLFSEEKLFFDQGDIPLSVQRIKDFNVGIMICFDWIFPEVARSLSLQGAQVLCHPANLVLPHCQQAMVTRALENRVFALTCNRFGIERRPGGSLTFTGRSQLVAPGGAVLCQAPARAEKLSVTEIDPEMAWDKAITRHNSIFADRRPELYGDGKPMEDQEPE